MRTLESYKERVLPINIQTFSPRIRKDLERISWPKEIEKMEMVESTYLYGNTEYGKTIYAVFLYLQECKLIYLQGLTEWNPLLFVSVPELYDTMMRSFDNKAGVSASQIMERCKNARLLVLDDLGAKKPSEWALDQMYLIINHRYENLLCTIITSNLDLTALAESFGDDRITSRIERMCKLVKKANWKK